MMGRTEVTAGMVFRGPYPFIKEKFSYCDEDGPCETLTWKPGTRTRPVYPDDAEAVAEGVGEIVLTVVSIHKPGRYPTRVFFTRKWRDPDGREWGKNGCRCVTAEKFMRLSGGYRYPFVVAPYGHHEEPKHVPFVPERTPEPLGENEIAF